MKKLFMIFALLIILVENIRVNAISTEMPVSLSSNLNDQNWVNVGPSYFYAIDGELIKGHDVLVMNIDGDIFVKFNNGFSGVFQARKTALADKGYRKFTHVFTLPDSKDTKRYFNYYY